MTARSPGPLCGLWYPRVREGASEGCELRAANCDRAVGGVLRLFSQFAGRSSRLAELHEPPDLRGLIQHSPQVVIGRIRQAESRWGSERTGGCPGIAQAGKHERVLGAARESGTPQAPGGVRKQPLATGRSTRDLPG